MKTTQIEIDLDKNDVNAYIFKLNMMNIVLRRKDSILSGMKCCVKFY